MTTAASEPAPGGYGPALARTYRYLRVGIAGTVVALIAAVVIESTRIGVLRSISAYYYTDARNVFVAALIAVSFGLLALSEPGAERSLRAAAALFGPLIALCPTSISADAVPGVAHACPAPGMTVCVPEPYRSEVAVGVGTYLVVASIAWVVVLVSKAVVPGRLRPALPSLAVAAAVILVVAAADLGAHDAFVENAHGIAALAFFGLFAAIAVLNATPRYNARHGTVLPKGFRAAYTIIAAGMVGAVLAIVAIAVAQAFVAERLPILVPELVELVLFFAFWVLQGVHKDRVLWSAPPRTPGEAAAGRRADSAAP